MNFIIDGYELGDWQENEWLAYRCLDNYPDEIYDHQFVGILKLRPTVEGPTFWIAYRDNYMKPFCGNKLYNSVEEAKAQVDIQIQQYLKLKAFI